MVTPEDIFKELQCCTMTITITNPDGISMNAAVNAEAHSCYPGHSENTHCISLPWCGDFTWTNGYFLVKFQTNQTQPPFIYTVVAFLEKFICAYV
jgi:hypothetical protein